MILCTIAERKLGEVALEIVVATYDAILCDDQKLLILGPAKALDRTMLPGYALDQLPGAAVDVYAGLG